MKKRIVVLLFLAFACSLLFAGCGNLGNPDGGGDGSENPESAYMVSDAEWDAALSEEAFANFRLEISYHQQSGASTTEERLELYVMPVGNGVRSREVMYRIANGEQTVLSDIYYESDENGNRSYTVNTDEQGNTVSVTEGTDPARTGEILLPALSLHGHFDEFGYFANENTYKWVEVSLPEFMAEPIDEVRVSFIDGRVTAVSLYVEEVESSYEIVMNFTDYGETTVELPGTDTPEVPADTEEMWRKAFAEESFANVTILMQQNGPITDYYYEIEHNDDGKTSLTHEYSDIDGDVSEKYYETRNGTTWLYTQQDNGAWTTEEQASDSHGTFSSNFFIFAQMAELFDEFTDNGSGIYTAGELPLDMGGGVETMQNLRVVIQDGKLMSFTFEYDMGEDGTLQAQIEVSKYGETYFDMPIPDVPIDPPDNDMTEDEWKKALAEDTFSNVSMVYKSIDGETLGSMYVYHNTTGDGRISYIEMDSLAGPTRFYCEVIGDVTNFYVEKDGSWILSDGSMLDAYGSFIPLVIGLQEQYDLFTYTDGRYVSNGEITISFYGDDIVLKSVELTFENGLLTEYSSESETAGSVFIGFSDYGETTVELPEIGEPEEPEDSKYIVTENEWTDAFSAGQMANVTLTINAGDMPSDSQIYKFQTDAEPPRFFCGANTGNLQDGLVYELTQDGNYEYFYENGQWYKRLASDSTIESTFLWTEDFIGLFNAMEYDADEKCYIGYEIEGNHILPSSTMGTLRIWFEDKFPVKIVFESDGGQSIDIAFSDHWSTTVEIPEDALPEEPSAGYTVDAEGWDAAFGPENLQNVTYTAIMSGEEHTAKVMLDASPARLQYIMEIGTSYYEIAEVGGWQYLPGQDEGWIKQYFSDMDYKEQAYAIFSDLIGLFQEAAYDEENSRYIAENVTLTAFGGATGTLYVYFENGRATELLLDAEDPAEDVSVTFYDYGETYFDLPEAEEISSDTMDETDWHNALAEEVFENVRVVSSADTGSISQSMNLERFTESGAALTRAESQGITEYYETQNGVTYHYFHYNDKFVKQIVSSYTNPLDAILFYVRAVRENYSLFADGFDTAERCYRADSLAYEEGNFGIAMKNPAICFEDGKLVRITFMQEEFDICLDFAAYGEISFAIPDGAEEIPMGPIDDADEVTAEQWMEALAESSFVNVTIRKGIEVIHDGNGVTSVDTEIQRSEANGEQLTRIQDTNSEYYEQFYKTAGGATYCLLGGLWLPAESTLFDTAILPVLQNLQGRFSEAVCGPTCLYNLPESDAGIYGTLYNVTVRFLDGKLVEIKGYQTPDTSANRKLVITFDNYGDTVVEIPAEGEIFGNEQWDALFAEENFANVSLKMGSPYQTTTVWHTENGGIPVTRDESDGTERYFRTENGVTWMYTLQNGVWNAEPIDDPVTQEYKHGNYGQAMFFLQQLVGKFGDFAYDHDGYFVAADIYLDMGMEEQLFHRCIVTFEGDKLSSVSFEYTVNDETQIVEITLYDYGTTTVDLPEVSA